MAARRDGSGRGSGVRVTDKALLLVCLALMTVGCVGLGWPSIQALANDSGQAGEAQAASDRALGAEGLIEGAEAYNDRLAQGQGIVGEPVDPYGNAQGDFDFKDDADYQQTLDMGGGVMGVLEIPKISLELPIRHGSGEDVLKTGIGHLHGTSMPVGGDSTHAVLTGHRGLEGATLFTRLDELGVGDPIYVESAGRTIAYEVDKVWPALDPADVPALLRIQDGEDRLTLVTCTPLFVNTQRLVVSARRALMPDEVAYPEDAPKDTKGWLERYGLSLLGVVPLGGFLAACVVPVRSGTTRATGARRGTGRHMRGALR